MVKCYDHKEKECVAIKIIKNKKRFNQQALIEISLLNALNKSNMDGSRYVVSLDDSFEFRNHIVLALSVSLLRITQHQLIRAAQINTLSRLFAQSHSKICDPNTTGVEHCSKVRNHPL